MKVTWCSNCLAMSTRPRIKFDERGFCNACIWSEEKKSIDWSLRRNELDELLAQNKSETAEFDCIVPVSGGKDGSYVAYTLKHKYHLRVLCLTVTPPLPLSLGENNLRAFVESGYDHVSINPDYEKMRVLNRTGFIEMGFPYYGWLLAIQTVPAIIARKFGVKLVFYGEDGEVEYGGTNETSRSPIFDSSYQRRIYLEGGYEKVVKASGLDPKDLGFFVFPEPDDEPISLTHWSYFENWDPYRNYLVAKEFCGLREADEANSGTFTNFSQNDQALYALHTYMMYLKFGFGRANQDASIEIRRGAMNRDQAKNLVILYDGHYPEEFVGTYLDYFQINKVEFDEVLDRYANKNLFEKLDGKWHPKFKIS